MRFENRNTSNSPEIEFTADVRIRELRFEEVPSPEVRFPGHPERESDWRSKRENLPNEVREGVVYRNAGVRLLIASEISNSNPDFLNKLDKERIGTNLENPGHRRQKATEQETESEEETK